MVLATIFEEASREFSCGTALYDKIQFQLAEKIVGPLLQIALLDDNELREITTPIFFDMLKTEYRTLEGTYESSRFCEVFIEKMNSLLELEDTCGDCAFRNRFIEVCVGDASDDGVCNCRC